MQACVMNAPNPRVTAVQARCGVRLGSITTRRVTWHPVPMIPTTISYYLLEEKKQTSSPSKKQKLTHEFKIPELITPFTEVVNFVGARDSTSSGCVSGATTSLHSNLTTPISTSVVTADSNTSTNTPPSLCSLTSTDKGTSSEGVGPTVSADYLDAVYQSLAGLRKRSEYAVKTVYSCESPRARPPRAQYPRRHTQFVMSLTLPTNEELESVTRQQVIETRDLFVALFELPDDLRQMVSLCLGNCWFQRFTFYIQGRDNFASVRLCWAPYLINWNRSLKYAGAINACVQGIKYNVLMLNLKRASIDPLYTYIFLYLIVKKGFAPHQVAYPTIDRMCKWVEENDNPSYALPIALTLLRSKAYNVKLPETVWKGLLYEFKLLFPGMDMRRDWNHGIVFNKTYYFRNPGRRDGEPMWMAKNQNLPGCDFLDEYFGACRDHDMWMPEHGRQWDVEVQPHLYSFPFHHWSKQDKWSAYDLKSTGRLAYLPKLLDRGDFRFRAFGATFSFRTVGQFNLSDLYNRMDALPDNVSDVDSDAPTVYLDTEEEDEDWDDEEEEEEEEEEEQ